MTMISTINVALALILWNCLLSMILYGLCNVALPTISSTHPPHPLHPTSANDQREISQAKSNPKNVKSRMEVSTTPVGNQGRTQR
jgi:hypothetical protein